MTTSPPALSTLIDIPAFYTSHGVILSGRTTNNVRDGREWHGSCPRCAGSTDRFSFWESGRFSCSLRSSGCGWHGSSPYWFLRDEGYSHRQACDDLNLDPYEFGEYQQSTPLPLFMTKDEAPGKKWMDAAEAFVWRAERYLWQHGAKAVEYLQSRGLGEDVLKKARIGYCPGWYVDSLESWGLLREQTGQNETEIKIPAGITFPYIIDGNIWKIQIKRFESDGSYFQVLGSSDCPFGIDNLEAGKPVLLTEGEFDRLSVLQEAGDLVATVATGGTNRSQSTRWITRLKQAPVVLVGFDQDENKAGDEGASWWLKKLPNSTRWTPWTHDANQMLTTGLSLRTWIKLGLRSAETTLAPAPRMETSEYIPPAVEPSVEAPVTPPALYISHRQRNPYTRRNQAGDLFFCSVCHWQPATRWEFNSEFEKAWCKKCWTGDQHFY